MNTQESKGRKFEEKVRKKVEYFKYFYSCICISVITTLELAGRS